MIAVVIFSGLAGFGMLALGCDLIVPLNSGLAGLCDFAAVPLIAIFFAEMDNQ